MSKNAGDRLGIYLSRGAKWGMPVVVLRDEHVQHVYVNDIITHVDGCRYWSTHAVASAIIKKGPDVTLTIQRRELYSPLMEHMRSAS